MLRRLAALAFAVSVIAGALAIRNADGPDTVRSVAEDNPYEVFRDDSIAVLCAEDLARLCDELQSVLGTTRVEAAWTTVDRLARGGQLGADAWLTFRPLEKMAAPPRPAEGVLGKATTIAVSPILLAGSPSTVATVEAACPNPLMLLSCAGAVEGVQLMLRDPVKSAGGALALAVVAVELSPSGSATLATGTADPLGSLLARGRFTPVPYEDVARLKGSGLALTLEADVNLAVRRLPYEARRSYTGVSVLYPFEARVAEVVVVSSRSFRRATDLATLLRTRSLAFAMERAGFEVPDRAPFFEAERVFSARPTIRKDLPPPTPERLRQLRASPRPSAATGAGR